MSKEMKPAEIAEGTLDQVTGGGTAVGNPGDADDKTSLLAHELTHVRQSVILAGDDGSEIMRYNLRSGGR